MLNKFPIEMNTFNTYISSYICQDYVTVGIFFSVNKITEKVRVGLKGNLLVTLITCQELKILEGGLNFHRSKSSGFDYKAAYYVM